MVFILMMSNLWNIIICLKRCSCVGFPRRSLICRIFLSTNSRTGLVNIIIIRLRSRRLQIVSARYDLGLRRQLLLASNRCLYPPAVSECMMRNLSPYENVPAGVRVIVDSSNTDLNPIAIQTLLRSVFDESTIVINTFYVTLFY